MSTDEFDTLIRPGDSAGEPSSEGSKNSAESNTSQPRLRNQRGLVIVAIVAAVAVVALTIVGVIFNPTAQSDSASTPARPQPTVDISATPLPTVAPSIIPASCEKIYTRDWSSELAPLALNPEWSDDESSLGSSDIALLELLRPTTKLTCRWLTADGPSEVGLITSLALVTPDEASLARSRMSTLGYGCSEELRGVRCVIEFIDAMGNETGESDFFRDNVWIATQWVGPGPNGYTADIVASLWK